MLRLIQFIIKKRKTVIFFYWIWVISWFSFVVYTYRGAYLTKWGSLGIQAADWAVYLLIITLFPGIIRRLGLMEKLKPIYMILYTFRRQIGNAVFILAASHFIWIFVFPNLYKNTLTFPSSTSDLAGLAALIIFLLLFLTSNNFSIVKMGRYWKFLHRLIHLAIFFILLHVTLKKNANFQLIVFLLAFTDVLSFIVEARRKDGKI